MLTLPTKITHTSVTSLIAKMRQVKKYYNRTPSDTEIRRAATKRVTNCHYRLDREFPEQGAYNLRAMIEMQSPLMTVTHHDEADIHEPEWSYSSKGLTDWYVAEFCRLNHLTN